VYLKQYKYFHSPFSAILHKLSGLDVNLLQTEGCKYSVAKRITLRESQICPSRRCGRVVQFLFLV
jgi:hypothetical protein